MTLDRSTLRWNAWGFAGHQDALAKADRLWSFLGDALGSGPLPHTPAKALSESRLAQPVLSFGDAAAFREAGCEVGTDAVDRAFHARGDSYRDLLDLRAGVLEPAPDIVVYPKDAASCAEAIAAAAKIGVAVVPFGGGTSVVGGVAPLKGERRAVVSVDTTRMNALSGVDPESMTASAEAGIYGPFLEAKLQAKGVTLGHYPQSFEFSTLGGWIAARGAGQQSNRYGKAEDWLVSARLATPRGAWSTEGFPASAAGPRLTDLVAGSEGTLGIITDATFAVHKRATARDYRAYLFHSFAAGQAAVRELVQAEVPVSSLRLSDEDETHFFGVLGRLQGAPKFKHRIEDSYLKLRGFGGGRCALIAGAEGDAELVGYARSRIATAAARHGALAVGSGPADRWFKGRFHGPYLRDPLMDRGLAVDTLETATSWANIPRLYAAIRTALDETIKAQSGKAQSGKAQSGKAQSGKAQSGKAQSGPGAKRSIVLAHVSHSYRDGASLYFTYLWRRASGGLDAEIAQWEAIKSAASDAIVAHGGTISHHHGAGTDHARWMAAEKGPVAMEMLRALKRSLDPDGIMNPGKLGL